MRVSVTPFTPKLMQMPHNIAQNIGSQLLLLMLLHLCCKLKFELAHASCLFSNSNEHATNFDLLVQADAASGQSQRQSFYLRCAAHCIYSARMYCQAVHHLPAAPASTCHAIGNAQSGLCADAQSVASACKRRKLSHGLRCAPEPRPTASAAIPLTAIKTSWHAARMSSRANPAQCRFAGICKWLHKYMHVAIYACKFHMHAFQMQGCATGASGRACRPSCVNRVVG